MNQTDNYRQQAIAKHDHDALIFDDRYEHEHWTSSAFAYGRSLILTEAQALLKRLPPGAQILDAGSGPGYLLHALSRAGFNARGLEPSSAMRAVSNRRFPAIPVDEGTVDNLPYSSESFHAVISIEVFRYLSEADNKAGLEEIRRVLKPGGLFFGTFVNAYALDGYRAVVGAKRALHWAGLYRLPFHTQFETPKSLVSTLLALGFTHAESRGALFAPLRIAYKASPRIGSSIAPLVRPYDRLLSSGPLKQFAGHLIAVAQK